MDSIVKKQTVSCNGRGKCHAAGDTEEYMSQKNHSPAGEACGNAGNGK